MKNYDHYNTSKKRKKAHSKTKKAEPEKPKYLFIKVGNKPDGMTEKEYYYFCMVYSYWKNNKLFFRYYWQIAAMTRDTERSIMKAFKGLTDKGWLIKDKKFAQARCHKLNLKHEQFWNVAGSLNRKFTKCYNNWVSEELNHLQYKIYCQLVDDVLSGNEKIKTHKQIAKRNKVSERTVDTAFKIFKDTRLIMNDFSGRVVVNKDTVNRFLRNNTKGSIKMETSSYKRIRDNEKRKKNEKSISLFGEGYVPNK